MARSRAPPRQDTALHSQRVCYQRESFTGTETGAGPGGPRGYPSGESTVEAVGMKDSINRLYVPCAPVAGV